VLKLEDLAVKYGPVAALKGISLEVGEGEVVALIGPNGAGKSTTLKAVVGLVRPSAGTIEFEGDPLPADSPEDIVRRGIVLVPEGRRIFGTLTVAENIALGATARTDRGGLPDEIERILERFPILRQYYSTHADRLSGGEQQQLAIARALIAKPRLMLLDEPSLGLAPLMIDLLFQTLRELKAEGATILLVEQAAARAVAFADRSYVLSAGQMVLSGTRDELRGVDFASVYLGGQAA
jgi:branched-chain amino acid transport system ATP-binding protein